jgi:hypothetical protein
MAICFACLIAVVVFMLGMFSYELAEYFLAEEQLKTSVQAAALACSTKLASLGNSVNASSQADAFATGTNTFRMNSVLGNSLTGAVQLASASQPATLSAGEATISFQLLNPTSQQPNPPIIGLTPVLALNPTIGPNAISGAVVEATATYGYVPTFARIFADLFAPMQIACTANSGVQQLDLIIALDLSGGMDDQTPVTMVQRYWDYDNNFPPHHIVYMMPAIDGDVSNPAQGTLGSLFNFEAPHLNGAFPQDLQIASSEPSDLKYAQFFSELPGSATQLLRSAGSTDDQNPPGNYNGVSVGDNGIFGSTPISTPGATPPAITVPATNPPLELDLQNIAALVDSIDTSYTWNYNGGNAENGENPWYYTYEVAPAAMGGTPPFTNPTPDQYPQQLAWYIQDALRVNSTTDGLVLDAINAGNARAGASAVCGVTTLAWQASGKNSYVETFSIAPGPGPVITAITGGGRRMGPNTGFHQQYDGYWRYGLYFASGSHNKNVNEVIVPTGTPGPNSGAPGYVPGVSYGPYNYNVFTDLVVNLDGNNQYGQGTYTSFTYNNYAFPTLGAVVEAARGNLESDSAATAAGLDLSALGVQPTAGYKNAYRQAALAKVQPLTSVAQTVPSFMSQLSEFGNVNFGLITFNDTAGTTSAQMFADSNVSADYPKGGTNGFRLPGVSLASNSTGAINTSLQGLTVGGGRNVAQSIQAALSMFANSGRRDSQKAIVLITDGAPTVDLGGNLNSQTALADARSQAALARAQGIPIYCISISGNNQVQTDEQSIYNDSNRDVTSGGLAAISGQGARFYPLQYSGPASTTTALTQTFGNITRQLNSLLMNQQQVALAH